MTTMQQYRSPEPVEGRLTASAQTLRRGSPSVAFGSTSSALRFRSGSRL
jgi:hypothetical protein